MGRFRRLDPRRLALDTLTIVGDLRQWCNVYRRAPGENQESWKGSFWGRISNIGRQTTGLESQLIPGNVTGTLWVLRVPPGALTLKHDDEIRTNGDRWRVVNTRTITDGQMCILSTLE